MTIYEYLDSLAFIIILKIEFPLISKQIMKPGYTI